ncbi:PTS transporter subunit EIIC [Schleiferilactobacillus harbinensis]|uniref:PTS transporter subunit EIIC n=1 Tax=Schleiferilactobacillus harbinensis TaxID=304207 RepID=UPI0039EB9186
MDNNKLAQEIVDKIGGKDNVNSLVHCVTRLRFKLKNEDLAKTDEIKSLDGVATVVQQAGQYQVVIGPNVADVYDEVIPLLGSHVGGGEVPADYDILETAAATAPAKKESIFSRLIDVISGVFTPLLGLLMANGIMKGLLIILVATNIAPQKSGTFQIFSIVSDCFFYFFPVFLGYTAMKKFGGTAFIGMGIGAALIYPQLLTIMQQKPLYYLFAGTPFSSPVYLTFFGIPVLLVNYATSVVPVIVASYVAAKLEKRITKWVNANLRSFLVPFLIFLIVIPLSFIVIGPITSWISLGLGAGAQWLFNLSPIIFGMLYGGLIQFLVIFGVHWGFVALSLNNLTTLGYDPITIMGAPSALAQGGAALAMTLRTKSKKVKAAGWSAFISSLFGITEPSVYGINLPRKKPFAFAAVGGAVGGAIFGLLQIRQYAPGPGGLLTFLTIMNPKQGITNTIIFAMIACVAAFVVAFILAYIFFDATEDDTVDAEVAQAAATESSQTA